MLAGRTLLRAMKQKEKNVLTLKLLADSTGKKMGKSEGNAILMTDAPEEMYGKVMSWTDGMILPAFEVLTDVSLSEIQDMNIKIAGGENPMVYKLRLAKLIVSQLISEKAGETAEKHFAHVHQQGERPEEMFELRVQGSMKLVDVLISAKCVSSKTDARRQIEQGGVKMNDVIIKDIHTMVEKGDIVQKGKRHFVKLI
jgi:tyrosyl-tRNA synthetase